MSKQNEILDALQLRLGLANWFGCCFRNPFSRFKLKAEHLGLHTGPSALTSFTHLYKLTARYPGPRDSVLRSLRESWACHSKEGRALQRTILSCTLTVTFQGIRLLTGFVIQIPQLTGLYWKHSQHLKPSAFMFIVSFFDKAFCLFYSHILLFCLFVWRRSQLFRNEQIYACFGYLILLLKASIIWSRKNHFCYVALLTTIKWSIYKLFKYSCI